MKGGILLSDLRCVNGFAVVLIVSVVMPTVIVVMLVVSVVMALMTPLMQDACFSMVYQLLQI